LCCFFLFFLFVSGSKAKIKVPSVGKWRPFVSFDGGFGQTSQLFFVDFWSQIYSTPLLLSRHAPLSRILLRRPPPLPEALVTPIAGIRRVACTR
jgi:hypothetical protein